MTPSPSIIAFIKGYEKCRLKAFKPTPNDVWTVGWGATGPDITARTVWTQAQCDDRFASDIAKFSAGVANLIGNVSTTQGQFDAMVSLSYNIGLANFKTSSVLTNHRAGHRQTAAMAFKLWDKQRNKVTGKLEALRGLVTRRAAEATIYLS